MTYSAAISEIKPDLQPEPGQQLRQNEGENQQEEDHRDENAATVFEVTHICLETKGLVLLLLSEGAASWGICNQDNGEVVVYFSYIPPETLRTLLCLQVTQNWDDCYVY